MPKQTPSIFSIKMDTYANPPPMSRHDLQNAVNVEKQRIETERIQSEENMGMSWARRQVYPAVEVASKKGLREVESKVPTDARFTSVSYSFALNKLQEWFPGCDIRAPTYEALQDSVRRSVIISWS
jgi:hypothetical protein